MDIELYPSTDEKLLYGETSTTNKQGAADHSSTASTSSQGPNVNVVESVISLQQDMATVTNTLQSLDKALKVLTSKRTAQVDEVSEIPPKMARSDINSDLSSLFAGAEGGETAGSTIDEHELEEDSSDEDTFLSSIESAIGPNNKLGPALENSKLASIVNKCFSNPISYDTVITKQDSYMTPNNCESVRVPRCNDEVWALCDKYIKKKDTRLTNIQRALVSASTAVARVTDELMKSFTSKGKQPLPLKDMVTSLTDAVSLMGHASHQTSLRRRDNMVPILKRDYAALKSPNVPVTSLLFGDDLPKTVKDLKQTYTMGKDLSTYNRSKNMGSKNYQRQTDRSRKMQWYNKPHNQRPNNKTTHKRHQP